MFQKSLIWTLIFTFLANSLPPVYAQGAQISASELHKAALGIHQDPLLTAIESDTSVQPKLNLTPQDKLVDQDPFFMRSQNWVSTKKSEDSDSLAQYALENDQVQISLPGIKKAWQLHQSVRPILVTSDYIFFAAQKKSKIFNEDGQGLFFVAYSELISASIDARPVAVHFFPLPGNSWKDSDGKEVQAIELPGVDYIGLRNTEGLPLPIALSDLKQMEKVQTVNLMFAQALASEVGLENLKSNTTQAIKARKIIEDKLMRKPPTSIQEVVSIENAFLAQIQEALGSHDVLPPKGSTAGFGMLFTGFDLDRPGQELFSRHLPKKSFKNIVLEFLGLPYAQAMDPQVVAFISRTEWVLTISGLIFAGAIAAKYTLLKLRVQKALKDGGVDPGAKLNFTLYAQALTFVAQLPLVVPANIIEFTMDKIKISENGIVRKLFNNTFGYVRTTNNKTPVNHKTLAYGVGILGGVDSALVALQFYILIPNIVLGLAYLFPQYSGHLMASISAPGMALYNLLNVMMNMVAYITTGAYSYAHEIQDITTLDAMRVVAERMRSEGLDPNLKQNEKMFKDRVNQLVRAELLRQGLPSEKTFIFDANSTYQSIQAYLGYAAPGDKPAEDFYGVGRSGLVVRALNKAIAEAETKKDKDVLEILLSAKKDTSLLMNFMKNPNAFYSREKLMEILKSYKRVRTELTSFTAIGAPSDKITDAAESWYGRIDNKASADLAAQLYRIEFYKLMNIVESTAPEQTIPPEKLDPFKSTSRYERWQLKRALIRTNTKFTAQTNQEADVVLTSGPDELKKQWEEIFRQEVLRAVGIYPDQKAEELLHETEVITQSKFEDLIEKDVALKTYLGDLNSAYRNKVLGVLKTDIYAETYTELAFKKEMIPPTAPGQAGRFQKIRQTELVRNSKVATNILRFAEGFYSDTRNKRGLINAVMREIPVVEDIWNGHVRAIKRFPVSATFTYLYMMFVWHAALPYKAYLINYLFVGLTIMGPWATTNRIMTKLGWKPGKNIGSMIKYATIGSFATFSGGIFYTIFQEDIMNKMDQGINFCSSLIQRIIN